MHSNSDNIETMIIDEADEVIKYFLIHLKVIFLNAFLRSIMNFHFLNKIFFIIYK